MAYDRKEYQKEYYKKNKDILQAKRKANFDYKEQYKRDKEKYRKFTVKIEKPLAHKLENKLIKDKMTITDFFRNAINEYIK